MQVEGDTAVEMEDIDLVLGFCSLEQSDTDQQQAFTQFNERYWTSIVRFLCVKTNKQFEAEDLSQRVFTKFYQKRVLIHDSIKQSQKNKQSFNVKAYLYRMAENEFIDWTRRQPKLKLVEPGEDRNFDEFISEEVDDSKTQATEELAMTDEIDSKRRQWLHSAFQRLPEKQRQVIELRMAELSIRDIAESMSISEATVKEYRKIALNKLKAWYQDDIGNDM